MSGLRLVAKRGTWCMVMSCTAETCCAWLSKGDCFYKTAFCLCLELGKYFFLQATLASQLVVFHCTNNAFRFQAVNTCMKDKDINPFLQLAPDGGEWSSSLPDRFTQQERTPILCGVAWTVLKFLAKRKILLHRH